MESDPLLEAQNGYTTITDGNRKSSTASSVSTTGKLVFWLDVAVFTLSSFLGGVAVAMLSPFYTYEAGLKGLAVWQASLVRNR